MPIDIDPLSFVMPNSVPMKAVINMQLRVGQKSLGMLSWLKNYKRASFGGDISAGVIVALMLIPQGMAYAIVAGLPPVTGLYASILPPIAYALFGSSMVQSVGPQAVTSLMIGSTLAALGATGSPLGLMLAAQMALIAGAALLLCGLLRLGFLANFLSRPVMSGFTAGAALSIAWGQVETLLGGAPLKLHLPSTEIGLGSLLVLWLAKRYLSALLLRLGINKAWADIVSKLVPVAVVTIATLAVSAFDLISADVKIVGAIPSGLPVLSFGVPRAHWHALLVPSLLIAFMVFLSSQSAGQTLAQKRNERIHTNHELLGLGAANLVSAVSGGFPVTGSISRSAVNYGAGANTPLASIISSILLALVLVAPTAWLSKLPLPALAATIILAVLSMIELGDLKEAWRYDRGDAAAYLTAIGGVLILGIEEGVILGVLLSFATLIWRTSRPHMAVVGRIPGSEHFRNVERHNVETLPDVIMLRVDAGLFFGNAEAVVEQIESLVAVHATTGQQIHHVVLVMSAVNLIDTTALHALRELNRSLNQAKIMLHFAEIKGPVMDRLRHSGLFQGELSGRVFLSSAQAYRSLAGIGEAENAA